MVMLMRIWMLRLGPNFIQQELWDFGSKVAQPLAEVWLRVGGERHTTLEDIEFSLDDRVALEVMKRVIQDEPGRPAFGRYVYAHLHIPHPSHHVDQNCAEAPWHTHYRIAACCAVRQFVELLSTLKKLDRLDQSLVILHSDHGWPSIGCEDELVSSQSIAAFARNAGGGSQAQPIAECRSQLAGEHGTPNC